MTPISWGVPAVNAIRASFANRDLPNWVSLIPLRFFDPESHVFYGKTSIEIAKGARQRPNFRRIL